MSAIWKREYNWRCLPIIGLTMLLTGCVSAVVPPCSTPQRLARLRQEQVLRSSINKRRRALVAIEVRSTALGCQKHPNGRQATTSCQALQRRSQSLETAILREETQLRNSLKTDIARRSLFGQQTACIAPQASTPKHLSVIHRSKHLHHNKQPTTRIHLHHKGHAAIRSEIIQPERPLDVAPVIAEVPKTASPAGKQREVTAAQSSSPPVAPPAEHDYIVDPHMRVIGRSFFQDDIKLPHETTPH